MTRPTDGPPPMPGRRLPMIRKAVLAFLADHSGQAFCSGCVEAALGTTAADVALREIEGYGLRRQHAPCAGCGKLRLVSGVAAGHTILVVDDRPESRYVTTRTLSAAGYDVREAATGREALRLARLSPDLIVLDVVLTDLDGFEVCRRLKSDAVTSAIPVVHKTAVYMNDDYHARALADGADAYLTEPVEPGFLLDTITRLLRRRA